ncbi:MAG TPA: RsmE family RNA methyltransferase [Candidatus Babeliales bacterium]|jgi:16S rRNA (uracil1498-N3)-methyltransferase|nr:RsmE family RNA methyltransferase [Candidatus Babeliales bacterium]
MSETVETSKEKHEFALYVETLSGLVQHKKVGDYISMSDEKLFHRMVTVLRLRDGQTVIFFDRKIYITATIESLMGKKQINMLIASIKSTTMLQPSITFLLPLLKKDDFETALYALAEVGVNTIQLVSTQKSGNQWSADRDHDRAQRILIAAAEQSKNFAYPELRPAITLAKALEHYGKGNETKIFFDCQGKQLHELIPLIYEQKNQTMILLVGPEGDLTLEEKKMVLGKNFIFCALTPTIMRAVQATALAAGLMRSLLR